MRLVVQEEQLGLGDAVLCARGAVGDEPFLLLLGDHLYVPKSNQQVSCSRTLTACFTGKSVVSVMPVPAEEVRRVGICRGEWVDCVEGGRPHHRLDVHQFFEKPSAGYAREHLVTSGLQPDHFLGMFGQYVLTPRIFEIMAQQAAPDFMEALEALRQQQGVGGLLMDAERFDFGYPEGYIKAVSGYAAARQRVHESPPVRPVSPSSSGP